MQENTCFMFKTSSWTDVAKEEAATMRKQRLRDELLLLRKEREVLMKIIKKKEVKKIQKKSIKQIFQRIKSASMMQWDLIMLLRNLESEDVALHVISSETRTILKRSQEWAKRIINSAHVMHRSFMILTPDVCIILNTSNQKKIIKRLKMNNMRLYEDLKMLRLAWFRKIIESEKIHSSLIVEIMIKAMINQLLNMSMLNLYQKCFCKLFKKSCCIMQC